MVDAIAIVNTYSLPFVRLRRAGSMVLSILELVHFSLYERKMNKRKQ
jgi:hypothetical protein